MKHHYVHYVLRLPLGQWPQYVHDTFAHTNHHVYELMQGPSELGIGGRLGHWDCFGRLADIHIPALVFGAEHDTMDPAHLRAMAERLPQRQHHHSPDGSHLAIVDDQALYRSGLHAFLSRLGPSKD